MTEQNVSPVHKVKPEINKFTESPKQSPTERPEPKKLPKDAMTFFDALKVVADGKAITKVEWDNKNIHLKMVNEKLMIKLDDNLYHPLIVTIGDINGDDWIVV